MSETVPDAPFAATSKSILANNGNSSQMMAKSFDKSNH